MVNSDKAGVLFTVDPSTRDPDRVVIEAAGVGEVVVLGQDTRSHVPSSSGRVVEEMVNAKEFMLTRDVGPGPRCA
jgi:pyruvate,water dikinase